MRERQVAREAEAAAARERVAAREATIASRRARRAEREDVALADEGGHAAPSGSPVNLSCLLGQGHCVHMPNELHLAHACAHMPKSIRGAYCTQ